MNQPPTHPPPPYPFCSLNSICSIMHACIYILHPNYTLSPHTYPNPHIPSTPYSYDSIIECTCKLKPVTTLAQRIKPPENKHRKMFSCFNRKRILFRRQSMYIIAGCCTFSLSLYIYLSLCVCIQCDGILIKIFIDKYSVEQQHVFKLANFFDTQQPV